MTQPFRIAGGFVDRDRVLSFRFNGRQFAGYAGDTLASALLANGVRLVGRSFKYHRPRGIFTAGSEEPNALVTLGRGARQTPNTRATVTELRDGLEAWSQNHRGWLSFDLQAVNDWLWPFLGAGFYYKTFMWPKSFWERVYEPAIRSASGLGALSGEPDPDCHDKGYLHCDILIVGAGPAGLAAARIAAHAGLRVIVADEDFRFGGRLNAETLEVEDQPGPEWAATVVDELAALPNVRLMSRTTVFGGYDHGIYGALERQGDLEPNGSSHRPGRSRGILWRIYSRRAILAAGSTERPIAFGNNDRPGIMLAGAVRAYVNRWGVAPGRRVAVFTNNDDGWRTASDLAVKGIEIAAIIDPRTGDPPAVDTDAPIFMGGRVADTRGRRGIRALTLMDGRRITVDCLAVSGGWNPNVHLTCHHRGRPVWDEGITAFVPGGDLPAGMRVAGSAAGSMTLAAALGDGHRAAFEAVGELGATPKGLDPSRAGDEQREAAPFWHVHESDKRAWLDLQNDVTTKDVAQAFNEGFRAPEHVKRYTTLGMATDQGKTAQIPALSVLANLSGRSIEDTGTTVYRPPYTPVPIAAFAGRARGPAFRPTRRTPGHDWAETNGASFVESGLWLRAQWFARPGENHWRQSVDREVVQTRASVGICDVSTLGKIDIQGRDAGEFIDRIYANNFATLAIGRVRYGLMLREDGLVMDDGTTARLSESHFLMTTTTANAVGVMRHLEFCRQCLWPGLDVHMISVTEQWAQASIAGPKARDLVGRIVDADFDLSNAAFPFMACAEPTVCGGIPARLFRISFSGELAYELAVPARYGASLMSVLMAAGEPWGVVAYGVEALNVMRVEKGHAAGGELDGRTTAADLGLGRMASKNRDFIGKALASRPGLVDPERPILVGIRPVDPTDAIGAGAHLVAEHRTANLENDEGWVSSVAHSPELGHMIGLGFVRHGPERLGEIVRAVDPVRGRETRVEIVSPHFIDPDGERLRV